MIRLHALHHNCLLLLHANALDIRTMQGMHEVLAVLLYALQQEKEQQQPDPSSSSSALQAAIADPAWLEADAFWLFDKLMLHLEVRGIYVCIHPCSPPAPDPLHSMRNVTRTAPVLRGTPTVALLPRRPGQQRAG